MVEDLNVDRVGGTVRPLHLKGKPELDDMKRDYSLVDQWRSVSLQVREYTRSKPDRTITIINGFTTTSVKSTR